MKINIFFLLTLITITQTFSKEYENQDPFFTDLEKELTSEYRTCTGDSNAIRLDSLLRWKNIINLRTEMPLYEQIRKDFIAHTGLVKDILPCQVLEWFKERLSYLENHEDSIRNKLLIKSDETVDSIRLYNELQNNPTSKFDFGEIPFGLSKKVFQIIFNHKFSFPLIDKRNYLLAEHFYLNENPFIIKFYFTHNDKFYKYEIESFSFTGNHLDKVVRPQAVFLRETMEKKIGSPDRLYRIGYFDIKSGPISPYARWEKETHTVTIGIGLEKIRYFTKETVESKKLNQ